MRFLAVISACLACGVLPAAGAPATASTLDPDLGTVAERAAAARIPFIANDGQIDSGRVGYYAALSSGTMFVTDDGELVYSLQGRRPGCPAQAGGRTHARWSFRETFVDGHPSRPTGTDPSAIRVSQFKGDRPSAWHPRLRTYDRVDLGEVYPGIRVTLRAAGNNVEKLLHLSPGTDPSRVKVAVEGVSALSLDDQRQLRLQTGLGEIVFTAPVAFQTIDGERRDVDVRYTLAENVYGFELGDHDPDHEVVIDPLLASTFIGGHNPSPPGNYDDDIVRAMVVVGDALYLAGATQSPDFPIEMGYDETIGGNFPDGFVTEMTLDLSTVVASTFIGTEGSDSVFDMDVDDDGLIVITGQAGWGFPVTDGAYTYSGTTPAGGGFLSKLSPDLSTLVASAIPTPGDYPRALARGNGGFYFGGSTNNPGFPITPNAWRSDCCPPSGAYGIRPYEGFAGELSYDLTTLESMTYLGGNAVTAMAVSSAGNVFITDGFDYAVTGYLARFDAGLTDREHYLSYYPGSTSGSSRTYFNDVALAGDSVVAVGQTYMNDLPATEGAFDTTCGTDGLCDGVGDLLVPRADGFVAKYSPDLQTTEALTYLGGSSHESIRAVKVAGDGSLIVVGETTSVDFPTSDNAADSDCGIDGQCDPTGPYAPTEDAFIARLTGDLSQLEYGSYLGGSGEEHANDVALDVAGNALVGGFTRSADFPTTPGALDNSYNGGTSDAFVSKFLVQPGASSNPGETCGSGMPEMLVTNSDAFHSALTVSYEPGCATTDNNLYYGPLEEVSSYGYTGQVCDLGMSGTKTVIMPGGSYFFVIVGDNDSVEGSYGRDSAQVERPAFGTCGLGQDLANSCEAP